MKPVTHREGHRGLIREIDFDLIRLTPKYMNSDVCPRVPVASKRYPNRINGKFGKIEKNLFMVFVTVNSPIVVYIHTKLIRLRFSVRHQ